MDGRAEVEGVVEGPPPAAEPQIKPRRLAAYLAGELRGQIRERDVRLEIHDRVGRGLTSKQLLVRPQRFRGAQIESLTDLAVPGFATARVEIYLLPDGDPQRGRVSLACGGTTVLDDLAAIDGVIEPRAPWSSGRLEGVVDFPDLDVAPTTRRGIVPNEAARAFHEALPALEARVLAVLAQDAERRASEREADVAKELRRLFRRLPRELPHYDLFQIRDGGRVRSSGTAPGAVAETPADPDDVVSATGDDEPQTDPADAMLYPPGPLATVEIRPRRSEIPLEGTRRLRAVALDADGRPAAGEVTYAWILDGHGRIDARGDAVVFVAPEEPCEVVVRVVASQGDTQASAEARVIVSEDVEPDRGGAGIPDPEGVAAPGEPWRSRIESGRWQYNTGHRDYVHVREDPRRRFRYLVHLFAKEIVLSNFGEPGDGDLLERMVQVLAYVGEGAPRRGA